MSFLFITEYLSVTVSEILTGDEPWDAVEFFDSDEQLELLSVAELRFDHEVLVVLEVGDELGSQHGDLRGQVLDFLVHSEEQVTELAVL